MAYILCLETATTNCSVALANKGVILAAKEDYNHTYSHAERLHLFIEDVMKEAGIGLSDLDAVAVSKGPGSYTGLRIGVSAAKGLCYALGIPLISIGTLRSLAHQIESKNGFIVPMIDARRMEVYASVFSHAYQEVRQTKAEIVSETSFEEYLNQDIVYFIGNGVSKFSEICSHKNANFIQNKLPSANEMTMISYEKFAIKDFEDVSYFEPYYLKDFIAG